MVYSTQNRRITMDVKVEKTINASKKKVWKIITDIEKAENNIKGIEKIEILEKPKKGILGLKWRETRTMFGKQTTEVMWITEVKEGDYYKTRAESHGAIYETKVGVKDIGSGTELYYEFSGKPVTLVAKIMLVLTGWMFKSATKKALDKDLEDIKSIAEN